jgi:ABC-2 type transport system ATP-binding protein
VGVGGWNLLKNDIEIEHLTKKYDETTAVDDLSLYIEAGRLFGLLGPNGSGKTTTINCLTGLVSPTSGDASVGGFDVRKDVAKVRELLGVCPQETPLYSYLTGRENVELFGSLYSVPKKTLNHNIDYLMEKLGLAEDARRRVSKYSGGMKRRVSLAMALVQDPEIILLDEPTVAMDPQSRRAVWDFIRELKSKGKTIVLTTHYMEEAEELCDTVGIIDHGRLIALGSPSELKSKYAAKTLEDVFIQLTGRKIREGA